MDLEKIHYRKPIILIVLILFGLCCLADSNNNPNAFIQRIFTPIHIGSGTIYYAGLFPLMLIFYSLKIINEEKEYKLLNTNLKRIIFVVMLLIVLPTFTQGGVKIYKSFYNDLNSIYCYRNNMRLSIVTSQGKRELICRLDLENCSNADEEFFIKVKLPSYLKDEIKELSFINSEGILNLHGKERRKFEIVLNESSINNENLYFSDINDFEFILFNNLNETKFLQKD